MSYDIHLEVDGVHVEFINDHNESGGTYAIGGTNEAWLNVTYNYAKHFHRIMERNGVTGVRSIYGMTAAESLPYLAAAMEKLGDDVDPNDYWNPTEGNAKAALRGLFNIATQAVSEGKPNAVWGGD